MKLKNKHYEILTDITFDYLHFKYTLKISNFSIRETYHEILEEIRDTIDWIL